MLTMMMHNPPAQHSGLSIVELLIAMLFGSMLLTMVIGLYVTGVSTGGKNLKLSRLRTDLQSLVAMIETDIRRAGYGGSEYLVGLSGMQTVDINSGQDCIVYYYNHDATSTLSSSNKMAFSLKQNSIKFKTNVTKIADDACASTSGWVNVSDNKFVKITTLKFTEHVTSNALTTMRGVELQLTGELVADSHFQHSITTYVQVRNIEFTH